jgi:predicted metal-dependent phosphoesterase TrpH
MIDLHTHSTASDGSHMPAALVEIALTAGLGALALTDHDTLAGLAAAAERARGTRLDFVAGVEIEVASDTGELHLLGLGLDGDRSALEEALVRVRRARRERNARMISRFSAAGIPMSEEDLVAVSGGGVISRAHFARLLLLRGIVKSTEAAFERYLGRGAPFYEARETLPLARAVALIRGAGGVPVVAHPLSLNLSWPALELRLAGLRDAGVGGLEAWHPNATVRECRRLERLARALRLAVTAGSDFHGANMPTRRIGRTAGGTPIDDRFLAALRLQPGRA